MQYLQIIIFLQFTHAFAMHAQNALKLICTPTVKASFHEKLIGDSKFNNKQKYKKWAPQLQQKPHKKYYKTKPADFL